MKQEFLKISFVGHKSAKLNMKCSITVVSDQVYLGVKVTAGRELCAKPEVRRKDSNERLTLGESATNRPGVGEPEVSRRWSGEGRGSE